MQYKKLFCASPAVQVNHVCLAETALRSVESIRQDPFWMPSIASLTDELSYVSKGQAADFMQLLPETGEIGKILSVAMQQRLQACYLPLVSSISE